MCCVLCAVCCVLCAVCCVLCAVCCVLWAVGCGLWAVGFKISPLQTDISKFNKELSIMENENNISHEWSYYEYLESLLNIGKTIEAKDYLSTILKKIELSEDIEIHYELPISESNLLIIKNITKKLQIHIKEIFTENKKHIVYWMRISLHINKKYKCNIDNIVRIYNKWRMSNKNEIICINNKSHISMDSFILRGAYSDDNKSIPKGIWDFKFKDHSINTTHNQKTKKPTVVKKDPYRRIGKHKYSELSLVIDILKESNVNSEFRSKTGPDGISEYNGSRKDLYNFLVVEYQLTLTENSFNKAIPVFVKFYPNKNMPILKNKIDFLKHKIHQKNNSQKNKLTAQENIIRLLDQKNKK